MLLTVGGGAAPDRLRFDELARIVKMLVSVRRNPQVVGEARTQFARAEGAADIDIGSRLLLQGAEAADL